MTDPIVAAIKQTMDYLDLTKSLMDMLLEELRTLEGRVKELEEKLKNETGRPSA